MINLLFAVTLACSSPCLLSIMAEGHGGEKEVIAKTGSMLPSIPIDSKLVVDESFYSLRPPRRFDIVLVRRDFRNPGDSAPAYNNVVARVVGLPGEAISIRRGNLYINGRRVKEPFPTKPCSHEVDEAFPCREMAAVRVPAGHYFLLADNRAESEDSRLWSPKTVPRIDLLGKVVRVILPTADAQQVIAPAGIQYRTGSGSDLVPASSSVNYCAWFTLLLLSIWQPTRSLPRLCEKLHVLRITLKALASSSLGLLQPWDLGTQES